MSLPVTPGVRPSVRFLRRHPQIGSSWSPRCRSMSCCLWRNIPSCESGTGKNRERRDNRRSDGRCLAVMIASAISLHGVETVHRALLVLVGMLAPLVMPRMSDRWTRWLVSESDPSDCPRRRVSSWSGTSLHASEDLRSLSYRLVRISHHIGGPSFIADVLSFLLYNVYGRLLR